MKTLIEVKKIKAYYVLEIFGKQRTVRAVDGVSLDVLEGSVHGIAGESGCGKTTLLKVLFAAVEPPLRLVDGKVYYLNGTGAIDLYGIDESERKKLRWSFASYVPQGSMSVLNPVLKIKDTFRDFISSHLKGRSKIEAYEMAKDHLKELGLPFKILDAYPQQLSGGMKQRVTITLTTAALAQGVKGLICDVPFLCHFERAVKLVDSMPYAEISRYCKVHPEQTETVFRTLSYFDGVNFAVRASCPALFSVALMYDICPPSTIFAAYNHYAGPKRIEVYPFAGHEGGGSYHVRHKLQFLQEVFSSREV